MLRIKSPAPVSRIMATANSTATKTFLRRRLRRNRSCYSEHADREREDYGLDGKLPHHAPMSGAEGITNRDLPLALRCPRQQQIGNIRARDQQEKRDRPAEDQ